MVQDRLHLHFALHSSELGVLGQSKSLVGELDNKVAGDIELRCVLTVASWIMDLAVDDLEVAFDDA